MEDAVERIVGYFRQSAQGLEERKQILYLLGPVGGGKSSLAEKLKELMEKSPIYVLATDAGEISPVFESPLGLFATDEYREHMDSEYGIDKRYLQSIISPWAMKRLKQFEGDISKFRVVRLMPNKLEQIGVMKTEPGDENNQDISTLVGKVDIRKLVSTVPIKGYLNLWKCSRLRSRFFIRCLLRPRKEITLVQKLSPRYRFRASYSLTLTNRNGRLSVTTRTTKRSWTEFVLSRFPTASALRKNNRFTKR
jgi:hypothetical protein